MEEIALAGRLASEGEDFGGPGGQDFERGELLLLVLPAILSNKKDSYGLVAGQAWGTDNRSGSQRQAHGYCRTVCGGRPVRSERIAQYGMISGGGDPPQFRDRYAVSQARSEAGLRLVVLVERGLVRIQNIHRQCEEIRQGLCRVVEIEIRGRCAIQLGFLFEVPLNHGFGRLLGEQTLLL